VLRKLDIPMVWLLGEEDETAPNERTISTLRGMIDEGKPFEVVLFPEADHSMLIFHDIDGERVYTGYAADYFTTETDRVRRLSDLGK